MERKSQSVNPYQLAIVYDLIRVMSLITLLDKMCLKKENGQFIKKEITLQEELRYLIVGELEGH